MTLEEPKGRVLVVDDDEKLLHAHERILLRAGYLVVTATNGRDALEKLPMGFDTVITDLAMPEMDGLTFLRAVREHDLDLPVILITGQPDVSSASEAVRFGAFRYLVKPVQLEELARETQRAVSLNQWAKLRRTAGQPDGSDPAGDRAGLNACFGRALGKMWMAYQPIVSCREKRIVGYEALMRTEEEALPLPGAILRAAERLDRCEDLGRRVRELVAATIAGHPELPIVFVNLHVRDLLDQALYAPDAPLTRHAETVVLEITERAALDEVDDVRESVARLRSLGFRVAIDDLGAGYSGLTSFAQLEPDYVKLDGALIRDLYQFPVKQKLVSSIAKVSRELGVLVIAEGVERAEEREALKALDCDLMQGYLFARPSKHFPSVSW